MRQWLVVWLTVLFLVCSAQSEQTDKFIVCLTQPGVGQNLHFKGALLFALTWCMCPDACDGCCRFFAFFRVSRVVLSFELSFCSAVMRGGVDAIQGVDTFNYPSESMLCCPLVLLLAHPLWFRSQGLFAVCGPERLKIRICFSADFACAAPTIKSASLKLTLSPVGPGTTKIGESSLVIGPVLPFRVSWTIACSVALQGEEIEFSGNHFGVKCAFPSVWILICCFLVPDSLCSGQYVTVTYGSAADNYLLYTVSPNEYSARCVLRSNLLTGLSALPLQPSL
jgi:hypothetical protein